MNAVAECVPARFVEPVYVFGSCISGSTVETTAALAQRFHQAPAEAWSGRSGNAYGIPFRSSEGQRLPIKVVGEYVQDFFKYARANAELKFRIARFGCDKDAFTDIEIAALFRQPPPNCALPAVWQLALGTLKNARLLIFDPSRRLLADDWKARFKRYVALNLPLWGLQVCDLLSIGGRDNSATIALAAELGMRHREIGGSSAYYGSHVEAASELLAIWHSTHLLSVTDPDQTAMPGLVRVLSYATRDGLLIDDLNLYND